MAAHGYQTDIARLADLNYNLAPRFTIRYMNVITCPSGRTV